MSACVEGVAVVPRIICMCNLRRSVMTGLVCGLVTLAALARADEADDQYAIAANSFARGDWKAAVEEFRTFLDRHSADAKADQAVFYLGEALLRSGDYRSAGPYYQQYLTRQPEGRFARSALFRLGEAAHFGGADDRAKIDLECFRSEYPNDRLNVYAGDDRLESAA